MAIFMDATYLNVRRDSVAKEPLHVLLGITPDGTREVLDYALYPTESAANYEEMLQNIKSRGVKQVLLFASDGLEGMRDAVKRQFPDADHQQCWVHLSRTVCRYIRNKDRKEVLGDLTRVYRAESSFGINTKSSTLSSQEYSRGRREASSSSISFPKRSAKASTLQISLREATRA